MHIHMGIRVYTQLFTYEFMRKYLNRYFLQHGSGAAFTCIHVHTSTNTTPTWPWSCLYIMRSCMYARMYVYI